MPCPFTLPAIAYAFALFSSVRYRRAAIVVVLLAIGVYVQLSTPAPLRYGVHKPPHELAYFKQIPWFTEEERVEYPSLLRVARCLTTRQFCLRGAGARPSPFRATSPS